MNAVLLHEYGPATNLKWEEIETPKPAEDEVLVRVQAASVNPIDFKLRSGAMKAYMPLQLPTVLGYDLAGTVEQVGAKVTRFKPGDRVFGLSSRTYAEFAIAKPGSLALIPGEANGKPALEMTTAGAVPLASTTGSQIVLEGVEAKAGQTILLTGALGSVGRVALFTAKEAGVKVIAVVRAKQIAEALALGADAAIDAADDAAIAGVGEVDAVADLVGHDLGEKLIARIRPGGIYASAVGAPEGAAAKYPGITARGFQQHADPAAFTRIGEAIRDGRLVLPIDREIPLSNAAEAHALAEKGGIGKVVLTA